MNSILLTIKRELNETIEALQQELDSLQTERNDLKDKLRFSTKKQLLDNLVNRQISSEGGSESTLTKMSSNNNLLSSNPLEQEVIKLFFYKIKNCFNAFVFNSR